MASMVERYNMMPRHTNETEDFTLYPEPPHSAVMAPHSAIDMHMHQQQQQHDAFSYPRSSHEAMASSMAAFVDPSLYSEQNYMFNRASPAMYADDGDMRVPSSNLSTASAPSAASSAVGSPQSNPGQAGPLGEWTPQGLGVNPGIVGQNDYFPGSTEYSSAFPGSGMDELAPYAAPDFNNPKAPGFVDPSLIHHHDMTRQPIMFEGPFTQSSAYPHSPNAPSPQATAARGSQSPFVHPYGTPYSPFPDGRRASMANYMHPSPGETHWSGDETKEKQRCTYPDCGKVFKDLKAHMLTHQNERPEKCPIQTCDYHIKGFARKYDKNRHTLTHYKGTMVCGFCPGSGSAAEKSFNRADVFKRHLTAVHGVEQTPPNSRKKTSGSVNNTRKLPGYPPDATGKCSTCSQTFSNAQDFYEHLDDCVLRIVQQEDPAEAINAQRLAEVENDKNVVQTLEKNNLPTTTTTTTQAMATEDDDEDEHDDEDMIDDDDLEEDKSSSKTGSPASRRRGNPANGVQKSRGLTHSRGGVVLHTKARGRKHRRDYPTSWGFDKGQMNMKKRVMTVFDGGRRLAKDDMMLSTDHEVRLKLADGKAYITDLDVLTLRRAEGFHGATEEEKGPWISDDPTEDDLKKMQEMLEVQ